MSKTEDRPTATRGDAGPQLVPRSGTPAQSVAADPDDTPGAGPQEVSSLSNAGLVEIIDTGRRYSWGRSGDLYCIWEKGHPSEPVATFVDSWRLHAYREFREMERDAQDQRHRRLVRAAHVAVLATVVLIALVLYGSGSPARQLEAPGADAAPAARHVNAEGGYSLRSPTGWSASTEGTATKLIGPNSDVSLSLDIAPYGNIDDVSKRFVRTLTAKWTVVEVEASQGRSVGNAPAVSVGGTGTDSEGTPIRFLTIVLDAGKRNFAIAVSTPLEHDPANVVPQIQEIVSSFQLLNDARAGAA